MPTVVIVATLDTKGPESAYLRDLLRGAGLSTVTIDCGALGAPFYPPEIGASDVAAAAGVSIASLAERRDRGEAVATMARGAAEVSRSLFTREPFAGIISLGGSAGTTIGTAAMRVLPIGLPKLMVSTMASGDTRLYVDIKDICMLYPVVDIAGLNVVSRRILANAAAAMAGMILGNAGDESAYSTGRPPIGATMFGVTTPCVTRARERLEASGHEVLVFHATGTGGKAMEDLIRDGFLAGVLDLTITELADELVGGVLTAGPDRLLAAGAAGIPQVIAPGALDMVNFGAPESVPVQFQHRQFYRHNSNVTLMRTTVEENATLGRIVAEKLNRATGPAAVLLPLRGVSAIDVEGGPFFDPAADAAFRDELAANISPGVPVTLLDNHINDPEFAECAAQELLVMMDEVAPANRPART